MNEGENIAEEQLNAFVDGELESEERAGLFDEAERSSELNHRLCQQRKLKELLKHAYRDVPEPRRLLPGRRTPHSTLGGALAASVPLGVGVGAGLVVHGFLDQSPGTDSYAKTGNVNVGIAAAENYILHVTSGKPQQMKAALLQARALLDGAEPGKPRQVEVVANEQGLDLLRSDVTPFAEEISALASEQVIFYACSKAIERLEEKGVEVKLVPQAVPGYTALDRVVERLQDGWQYVKI